MCGTKLIPQILLHPDEIMVKKKEIKIPKDALLIVQALEFTDVVMPFRTDCCMMRDSFRSTCLLNFALTEPLK